MKAFRLGKKEELDCEEEKDEAEEEREVKELP